MVRSRCRTYIVSVARRGIIAILCIGALGVSVERARTVPAESPSRVSIVGEHLGTAISRMDRESKSVEYLGSIEYLREHSEQAVAEASGFLLESPGSFRKWQLAYLVGEFGGAQAVETLRRWVAQPLPRPEPSEAGQHRVDLAHSEELSARVQAVSSMARIAARRPDLRDEVVVEILAIATETPTLRGIAMFELREILGADLESLRDRFPASEQHRFDPYMPAPEWQGLLQRRTAKHRKQRRELAEAEGRVCRAP
jgi:hypothetical protein